MSVHEIEQPRSMGSLVLRTIFLHLIRALIERRSLCHVPPRYLFRLC